MKIKTVKLEGFKGFDDSGAIEFGQITVLVGANNSGKSSILSAIGMMQIGGSWSADSVRIGHDNAVVTIELGEVRSHYGMVFGGADHFSLRMSNGKSGQHLTGTQGSLVANIPQVQNREPQHFIVPFLSQRKVSSYNQDIREDSVKSVTMDLSNLAAKLNRLSNSMFPRNEEYVRNCKSVLGFALTSVPAANGHLPGIHVKTSPLTTISVDQMGAGVPNIAGLIADLTMADGKLFLIEEPENDLHPAALKALLSLIVESSKRNQFVISTHSHVVVSFLAGASDSFLYQTEIDPSCVPPRSSICRVDSASERIRVLQELGYEFSDFGLWDGWIFLEESSAERIIRDYLIPYFAPELRLVRTFSANGVDAVGPKLDEFNRLMVFVHLSAQYKNKVWVRVDGDEPGRKLVGKLRSLYPEYRPDSFEVFRFENFEEYYPEHFAGKVVATLSLPHNQKKAAKKELLDEVIAWLEKDKVQAKTALAKSAGEVIESLRKIERQLNGADH
jgi:predicted ATPase